MEDRQLRETFQLLAQIVAQQAHRQEAGSSQPARHESSRIRDFLACDPPEFSGTGPNDDPQEFVRQVQRTLRVIGASETESVELASYRLRGIAANWYDSWRLARGQGSGPALWEEFSEAFLAHFLPPEVRRAREDRFLSLRQRGRSIREYSMEFDTLAPYAPSNVTRMEDRVHRYIVGLDPYYLDGCMILAAQPGMDIARIQAYAQSMEDHRRLRQGDRASGRNQQKRARSSGQFGDSRGRPPPQQQQQQSRQTPQPAQSSPPQFTSRKSRGAGPSPDFASSGAGRNPGSSARPSRPHCTFCGRPHFGECRLATGACFTCGEQGHQARNCPVRAGTSRVPQSTGSIGASSSASVVMHPTG